MWSALPDLLSHRTSRAEEVLRYFLLPATGPVYDWPLLVFFRSTLSEVYVPLGETENEVRVPVYALHEMCVRILAPLRDGALAC